jgi:hypothetical protein
MLSGADAIPNRKSETIGVHLSAIMFG